MPPKTPPPLGLAFTLLRLATGRKQKEVAEALGISASVLCAYESGDKALTRERFEALTAALGADAGKVDTALFCAALLLPARCAAGSPVEPCEEVLCRIEAAAARAGKAAVEAARQELLREARAEQAREDRRRADELWGRLKLRPASARLALVEEAREYQSWALVEKLCAESERAAADDPERALDLAELALRTAAFVPGEEPWRSLLQGYAWGHIGNARRVASDLWGAEEAFQEARVLSLDAIDPGPLDGSRLLDLEASLLRDQRQMKAALEKLDQALALRPTGEAAGRLLLKKGTILEQMGRYDEAIGVLAQAVYWIDGRREPRWIFGLRFNLLVNLCHVGRYREAEARLPELRALAAQLDQVLDGLRLRWLEGRIAAGVGRSSEAIEAFARVRAELSEREIRYDEALVGMELAGLYLEQGRTAEVKRLVRQMAPVFQDRGVHEEARKALDLFRQAVDLETVTLELVRRLVAYLYRAQNNPSLRFEFTA